MLLIEKEIFSLKNQKKSEILQRFFKTGKGEYGEGDKFLGVVVPQIRILAKKYKKLDFKSIKILLNSKWHEIRLIGLIILTYKFDNAKEIEQKQIIDFYLNNTDAINNWDLVDLSCYKILGKWCLNNDRKILYTLANSKNMWERRIAIVSTFTLIQNKEYIDTFKLCEQFLTEKHDLMHKACGWMLREVSKRISEEPLYSFLNKHYKQMPRTMLRYAIERLPIERKKYYMKK